MRPSDIVIPSVEVCDSPSSVAFTVAEVFVVTVAVAMENFTEVAPAGTVTVEGTIALVELLDSVTGQPPVGAADERVKVPVAGKPPITE